MKSAEQWVKEQQCPEEWASEREVKMIQSDAREELVTAIREALELLEDADIQTAERVLKRAGRKLKGDAK